MSNRVVLAVIAVPILALAVMGAQFAPGGPNQAVITQVETDLDILQLLIHGRNFCTSPAVTLGSSPLSVLSAASDGPILAMLPDQLVAGGYLLTVDCGKGANGFASWDLAVTPAGSGSGAGGFPAPDFDSGWVPVADLPGITLRNGWVGFNLMEVPEKVLNELENAIVDIKGQGLNSDYGETGEPTEPVYLANFVPSRRTQVCWSRSPDFPSQLMLRTCGGQGRLRRDEEEIRVRIWLLEE